MTRDESALLAAVCAAPDDDVPRLVYADWLDEHDQPARAEFIRGQCELARHSKDSPRRRAVAFRCRQLWDEHAATWVPKPLTPGTCRFRRGFAEAVELTAHQLGRRTADLFATTPIRRLWVTYLGFELKPLRHVPADNHVTAVDLSGNDLVGESLTETKVLDRFTEVRELGLMLNGFGDGDVPALCGDSICQRAEVVRLGGNPFTAAGRQRLRRHFVKRVRYECEREAEHLFTFDAHASRLTVGFGRNHTQVLFVEGESQTRLAVFDHAGNILSRLTRPTPADPKARAAFHAAWRHRLAFTPATIRVKRFRLSGGVGIGSFVPGWVDVLEQSRSAERETALHWLERWLDDGQFRWSWGNDDWWLNRDGEVTDT